MSLSRRLYNRQKPSPSQYRIFTLSQWPQFRLTRQLIFSCPHSTMKYTLLTVSAYQHCFSPPFTIFANTISFLSDNSSTRSSQYLSVLRLTPFSTHHTRWLFPLALKHSAICFPLSISFRTFICVLCFHYITRDVV